jgi:hypothetical protein
MLKLKSNPNFYIKCICGRKVEKSRLVQKFMIETANKEEGGCYGLLAKKMIKSHQLWQKWQNSFTQGEDDTSDAGQEHGDDDYEAFLPALSKDSGAGGGGAGGSRARPRIEKSGSGQDDPSHEADSNEGVSEVRLALGNTTNLTQMKQVMLKKYLGDMDSFTPPEVTNPW